MTQLLSFVAEFEDFDIPVAISAHNAEEATQIALECICPKFIIDSTKGFKIHSDWSYSEYSEKMREQEA